MKKPDIKRRQRGFAYWFASIIVAGLATILPGLAIRKVSETVSPIFIAIYVGTISLATICAYWSDKKKAKNELWRIPESTLHLLELVGGWPAAYFSQRIFRHKISKKSYQVGFWMIAALHHYAAFDYINEWRYTKAAFKFVESILK